MQAVSEKMQRVSPVRTPMRIRRGIPYKTDRTVLTDTPIPVRRENGYTMF